MRRGELLVLRICDLHPRLPLLTIPRRADSKADKRREEPNTKTFDREIELAPSVMKALRDYINVDRRAIRAARMHQYIIVSDEGAQLTLDSVNKMFTTLRVACPGLPSNLTAHILRHTWNDRFSEHAEAMQMSPEVEQKARANQQGWVETSGTAATYTRRYITKKAREATLKLQMELEEKAYGKSR